MSKIAVFDSGLGGLTVLSELLRVMPGEDYIYYGDSAHAPFGDKSDDELFSCSRAIVDKCLATGDIKCFVIACNTTTSRILRRLQHAFPDELFMGITPAIASAAKGEPGGHILVLATAATVRSDFLLKEVANYANAAAFSLLAAPGIVPYVESLEKDAAAFADYLAGLLADYREETDAVVLGCTHFPFVKDELRHFFAKDIRFYDAAPELAGSVRDRLFELSLLETRDTGGSVTFLNSDPAKMAVEETLLGKYMRKRA